jgi:anti-sigma factor RsiW
MNHLTPDELIDAVEGTLDAARGAHLDTCTACGEETASLRAILHEARQADMPEPSPLFWDHFSARVRAAIETEQTPRRAWLPQWLRWPVLVPLAGLVLLVLALANAVPRTPAALLSTEADARAEGTAAGDLSRIGEREWAVVSEIVGALEIEEARDMGIAVNPGDAERIALRLSAAEQRELVRLIKEEMDKAGD